MTIFIQNKYTRWYYIIIHNASQVIPDSYTEKHHIIPKSLGGSNEPDNIVLLSARQHFICHWLLTKMVSDKKATYKMANAFNRMMKKGRPDQKRYYLSGTAYENARIRNNILRSGKNHPFYGKKLPKKWRDNISKNAPDRSGRNNPFYGKQHKEETKEMLSSIKTGKPVSSKQKALLQNVGFKDGNTPWNKGLRGAYTHTEESLRKQRNHYVVTFPDGSEIQTDNLATFCLEHGLSLPAMRDRVAKNKQEHHKGYKCAIVL